ncbi:MAG: branched-chain amino acid ABC transporter permease [Spirochaetes bacterium]|nr:branched-chain amino acid ABC transporter permease [Spirochaetota bacterium]
MNAVESSAMNPATGKINRYLAIFLVLVLAVLPLFVKSNYLQHLLIMFFYAASTSLAWNIIGGYGGQMSLGHSVFIGIGAYASAILQTKFNMIPLYGFFLGVAISMAFSFIVYYQCFRLRGPYFTMATLAISLTLLNLFLNWNYIGKAEGILVPVLEKIPNFWWFQFDSKLPYYYLILILFVCYILITRYFGSSRLGYALLTIKQNEKTAISIGINNPMVKAFAVMLSAGMMSVLGSFYFQYIRYIDPEIFLVYHSIDIVLPAIIGGLGTVAGPIIGTIIIFPLTEILRGTIGVIYSGSHYVIIAIIMIVMIFLKPEGLNSILAELYRKAVSHLVAYLRKPADGADK